MGSGYKNFAAEDLLLDEYFIHSMRYPTQESSDFWDNLIRENIISQSEFDLAKEYLNSVSTKKTNVPEDTLQILFKKIEAVTVKKQKNRSLLYFSLAGCITLLLAISFPYFMQQSSSPDDLTFFADTMNSTISQNVELILSDNKHIAVDEDSVIVIYKGIEAVTINGKAVVKNSAEPKSSHMVFNQLNVPYGKSSKLILEDGTAIWVNAGTRIAYPVSFETNTREIYVDGEIYMDVVRDEKRPFHVHTSTMEIVVLGTAFNITAYKNDIIQSVILVNGAVQVNDKERSKPYLLKPDQMLTKQNQEINIESVNVEKYISWKDGLYMFHSEKLRHIVQRLSRYYNVTITTDEKASELVYDGKVDLKNDIRDVIRMLETTAPVDCVIGKEREYHFMFNPVK